MKIGCYHLISDIHNQGYINQSLEPFVKKIEHDLGESLNQITPKDFKKDMILPIIFIKSGGVEEKFKRIYQQFSTPYFLMAGCLHNALPAALEIKSFLRKRGEKAEIIHGSADWIALRLKMLKRVIEAKKACRLFQVGVLGEPSDWLIASKADYHKVKKKWGMKIFNLPLEEMIRHIDQAEFDEKSVPSGIMEKSFDPKITQQALKIYQGLKNLVQEYRFNAITVRCFELLDFYKNTGCLALSLLNNEGIVAGCEGDVPALISMILLNVLTKEPVFMANTACIHQKKNEILFAHCTIPTQMCKDYQLDSHFESGLGVGIKGKVEPGPVTIFKIDGQGENYYLAEGYLTESISSPNLCRSQLKISLNQPVNDFLERSIANHHVICKGSHRDIIEEFWSLTAKKESR